MWFVLKYGLKSQEKFNSARRRKKLPTPGLDSKKNGLYYQRVTFKTEVVFLKLNPTNCQVFLDASNHCSLDYVLRNEESDSGILNLSLNIHYKYSYV